MKRNVSLPNRYSSVDLDIRSTCPYCGVTVDPKILNSHYNTANSRYCFITLQCTNCEHAWADEYWDSCGNNEFHLQRPQLFKPTLGEVSADIKKLSPQGAKTYEQALQAELQGYDTLVGIGLRKALEFFLKDYLILINPNKADHIRSSWLGSVIKEYVNDSTLLNLAKATAYIGNDETHYLRLHENRDTQDMKRFLEATLQYIRYQLTMLDAQDFLEKASRQ